MTTRLTTHWATLTPEERRTRLLATAWHYIVFAQARRWCKAHPPRRRIPNLALRFGALNAILEPDPRQVLE